MRKEIYENQESSDTLPFHWEFGKEEITLKVSSYAYGNGLAVLMYSQSEGELELFSDLTVNLPGGYGLKTQEAFVSGDFTRDKNRKKSKGDRQEKRKEKERDRSIWK